MSPIREAFQTWRAACDAEVYQRDRAIAAADQAIALLDAHVARLEGVLAEVSTELDAVRVVRGPTLRAGPGGAVYTVTAVEGDFDLDVTP